MAKQRFRIVHSALVRDAQFTERVQRVVNVFVGAYGERVDKDIHDALNAFAELSIPYQGAVDNPEPLFRRRGAAAGASA